MKYAYLISFLLLCHVGQAQSECQLTFYEWTVKPNLREQNLEATAVLHLRCPQGPRVLSLKLDPTFNINSFEVDGYPTDYKRQGERLTFAVPGVIGASDYQLSIRYEGAPINSNNPPWAGGWYWTLDQKDRSWLSVVAGEDAAASWFPILPGQLADSSSISVISTSRLSAVATGQPTGVVEDKKLRLNTHSFFYPNPIDPADFQLALGHFERFDTTLISLAEDTLSLHLYFKDYNFSRGSRHFRQLADCYAAWQHFLGPLNFGSGSLTFVQSPHPGSAKPGLIHYGNRFMRGNFGGFIPKGMEWDYELVRHTAEQYVDHRFKYLEGSDNRWIKHAWTTYLESLYVEFHFGPARANDYLSLYRPYLLGFQPLIDSLANNIDLYDGEFQAKGALLLHTLRRGVNDDQKWFVIIKDLFGHSGSDTVNSNPELISYLEAMTGLELSAFFEQYFYHRRLPRLELKLIKDPEGPPAIAYRYAAEVSGYNLPLGLMINQELIQIQPTSLQWQTISLENIPADLLAKDPSSFVQLSDNNILVELSWVRINAPE